MAKGAATEGKLGQLHEKVATVLLHTLDTYDKAQAVVQQRLENAVDDAEADISTLWEPNPALIGAAIKFLKDNSITCQAEESEAMSGLERRLADKAARRSGNVVQLRDVAVGEE